MKKNLNYTLAAAFLASSLAFTACTDNSAVTGEEGTTTGGLDVGAASTTAGSDTTMTGGDTHGTTTTGTTTGATTH